MESHTCTKTQNQIKKALNPLPFLQIKNYLDASKDGKKRNEERRRGPLHSTPKSQKNPAEISPEHMLFHFTISYALFSLPFFPFAVL